MYERYTEKARRVIYFAVDEAKVYRSPAIESEHLLLGLLRESQNILAPYVSRPIVPDELRQALVGGPAPGEPSTVSNVPLSNACKRILAYGAEEAERLRHRHIGTEHLLLGILREQDSTAASVLRNQGLNLEPLRIAIADAAQKSGALGCGIGAGSTRFERRPGIGLIQANPTEFLLVQHNRSMMPRIGEVISIHDEGFEPWTYRIQDIVWQYERSEGVAQLETVKLIVEREPAKPASSSPGSSRPGSPPDR
jgi:hypothetical protein